MRLYPGMLAAACLLFPPTVGAQTRDQREESRQFSVRWVGQDGHDFVGPSNRLEPSEVQDMHLVLTGLDPDREIVFVDVTTPSGGDQWQYNAQSFSWKAELKRSKGARTADLFLEPGHIEAPGNYHVLIRDDRGTTREFDVRGRKVNRGLRMPGAVIQARWLGQDKHDRVGSGPSVGPDGLQDARIRLAGLSTKVPVVTIRVEGQGGAKWQSGVNAELLASAEFWPDQKKPGEGDLNFQPDRDLKGQKLKLQVVYNNETSDAAILVAGRFDPKLRMPETPLPRIGDIAATARWLGQDGVDATGPGDVHVQLSGLARSPSIAAAVLTDSVRGTWLYRATDRANHAVGGGDVTGPLVIRPGNDRGTIDLFFAPYRDETKAGFTLRLIDGDGRSSVARFEGSSCDPARRAARPADTKIEARPGDDLNVLANQYGTVSLAAGTYRLAHPLILERPVTITGDGKATVVFAQGPADPPWTTAVKIHAANTTLNGFAVRFEGPVRWDQEVSYGPAVIGTTDNRDQGRTGLKVNLTLTRLDLESPPAADPLKWVDATRLMRLTNARGGMIAGNVLRGGTIEFFDGPWQILNNDFRGTPVGTFSYGIFTGHGTHDTVIQGNRAKPVEPAGKTWRFLVLTHRGSGDRVVENTIEDIGAREGDTIPWANAPEIILTEAYHLTYEGRLAALSADGRVMRIHHPQGQEAATGDVVSLLAGPAPGEFRRIAQVIDPETYLVDPPIPKGTEIVSISRGFVGEVFLKNRIDIRGGRKSGGLILVGNHFGSRIVKNHVLGGDLAMKLTASPTETPVIWGWSHAPFLGGVIEENIIEDAERGAVLSVEHHARAVKTNKGRTYMTIVLNDNVVRWSDAFLKRLPAAGSATPASGLVLGDVPSHDPGEFVVRAARNRLEAQKGANTGASLVVNAAEYNGQKLLHRKFALPAEPGRPSAASAIPGGTQSRR